MRLQNDPIASAVIAQMASPGNASDDRDAGLRSLPAPFNSCGGLATPAAAKPTISSFQAGSMWDPPGP